MSGCRELSHHPMANWFVVDTRQKKSAARRLPHAFSASVE